jgi:hypothetical protein
VPEQYGGIKLEEQAQTFAIIAEELARGDSGFADIMGQVWKVPVLLSNIMPEHLQDIWFPKFMEDPTFLIAHCLTEPRGASDRWLPYNVPEAAMQTKAELKDGHWVINGRKQFITNGYDAKLYVVYANTNPKVGIQQGTSSFLIPRDTPGLIPVRTNEKMGARYMNNGEIVFDNCRIPEDHFRQISPATQALFKPGKILQARKISGRRAVQRNLRSVCGAARSSSSIRQLPIRLQTWRSRSRRRGPLHAMRRVRSTITPPMPSNYA